MFFVLDDGKEKITIFSSIRRQDCNHCSLGLRSYSSFSFCFVSIQSLKKVANQMGGLETEVPLVKSHVARFGAMASTRGLVTLTELSEPFEGGVHYPLFLLCLQDMHKMKGESWLVETFNNSKLDLQRMLPGGCCLSTL